MSYGLRLMISAARSCSLHYTRLGGIVRNLAANQILLRTCARGSAGFSHVVDAPKDWFPTGTPRACSSHVRECAVFRGLEAMTH